MCRWPGECPDGWSCVEGLCYSQDRAPLRYDAGRPPVRRDSGPIPPPPPLDAGPCACPMDEVCVFDTCASCGTGCADVCRSTYDCLGDDATATPWYCPAEGGLPCVEPDSMAPDCLPTPEFSTFDYDLCSIGLPQDDVYIHEQNAETFCCYQPESGAPQILRVADETVLWVGPLPENERFVLARRYVGSPSSLNVEYGGDATLVLRVTFHPEAAPETSYRVAYVPDAARCTAFFIGASDECRLLPPPAPFDDAYWKRIEILDLTCDTCGPIQSIDIELSVIHETGRTAYRKVVIRSLAVR